ncbi:MAG: hypothetical protein P4L26_03870 [Terracidiphilus sp.]|nr:hypothetical protein [Terracidiphilus sp.]
MAQAFRSARVVTPKKLGPARLPVEGEQIAAVLGWDETAGGAAQRDFGDIER